MNIVWKQIVKWASALALVGAALWLFLGKVLGHPVIRSRVNETFADPKQYAEEQQRELREVKRKQREQSKRITKKIEQTKQQEIKKRFHEVFSQ